MIKSISARVLMVMACCVWGAMVVGCQGEMNPSSLTTDPNGDVDLTSLDNLHVEGTLEVNGVSETGPLNLLTLQLALLAQCYDEMVFDATLGAAQDTPVAEVCMNGGLQHDFQNENGCHENVCAQQLYLCLGLKNQELAETVSPIEFSAKPFLPNEGDSYMNSDGSYRLQLIYDGNSQVYARHTYNHTYSIPPQSAPNRSLLHRAAVYSFQEAAIRGVRATDSSVCPWLYEELSTGNEDAIIFTSHDDRTENTEASSADLLVAGLAETVERLQEATADAIQNERSVASTLPGQSGDRYRQISRRWQGRVNSESAALSLISGGRRFRAAREALPPIFVDAQRAPTRRAIELLRAAAVDIDESRSIEDIMADVAVVLNPLSAESGVELSPDEVIRNADTTWADISLARRYLLEERVAYRRNPRAIPDAGPIERFSGMEEPITEGSTEAAIAFSLGASHNMLSRPTALDDASYWTVSGGGDAYQDIVRGPHDDEQTTTAEEIEFNPDGSVYQSIERPYNAETLTFSIWLKTLSSHNGVTEIEIYDNACGLSESLTAITDPNPIWSRYSVSAEIGSSCTDIHVGVSHSDGYARIGAWGAQLEIGTEPTAFGYGANPQQGIEFLLHPTHRYSMSQSYLATLDGVRHGIARLQQNMGQDGHGCKDYGEDCDEYADLLSVLNHVIDNTVEDVALTWENPCDDEQDSVIFKVCGIPQDWPVLVVQGDAGRECALQGRLGEEGCDQTEEGEDILRAITGSPQLSFAEEAGAPGGGMWWCATTTAIDLPANGEPLYVLTRMRSGGDASHAGSPWEVVGAYVDGCGAARLNPPTPASHEIDVDREDDDGGEPETLPCDEDILNGMVPPLENELTEDSDPYENSWRHYLSIARRSADQADALCQQMIAEGLDMDMRSEAARNEIAELCGASVDYNGSIGSTDAEVIDVCSGDAECQERLETCRPATNEDSITYRIPYVSLGNPLCMFVSETLGPCQCSPGDTTCDPETIVCPMVLEDMPEINDDYTIDDARATCESAYGNLEGLNVDNYTFEYVTETLGVFSTPPALVHQPADCERLHELRYRAACAAPGSDDANEVIDELRGINWLNSVRLNQLAKSIRLVHEYPNHFSLVNGGKVLATTLNQASCPSIYPWRESRPTPVTHVTCDSDSLDDSIVANDVYLQPGGSSADPNQRISWPVSNTVIECNDHLDCTASGCPGLDCPYYCERQNMFGQSGRNRIYWAEHIAMAITYLQTLGALEYSTSQPLVLHEPRRLDDRQVIGGYSQDILFGVPVVHIGTDEDGDEIGYRDIYIDCCDTRWGASADEMCEAYYSSWNPSFCGTWMARDFLRISPYPLHEPDHNVIFDVPNNRIWSEAVYENLLGMSTLVQMNPGEEFNERYDVGFRRSVYGTQYRGGYMHPGFSWATVYYTPRSRALPIASHYRTETWDGESLSIDELIVSDDEWELEGNTESYMIETPLFSPYLELLRDGDYAIHNGSMWNALELACWAQEVEGPICPTTLSVERIEDLNHATRYLECVADEIHADMSRQYIANIPRAIHNGFMNPGTESYYPSFGGQQLEALMQLEYSINQIVNAVDTVERALDMASVDVRIARAQIRLNDIDHERALAQLMERQLNAVINLAQTVGQAASNGLKGLGGAGITIAAEAARVALIAQFNALYAELEDLELEQENDIVLGNLSNALGMRYEAIVAAKDAVVGALEQAQSAVNRMERIESRVDTLLAQAALQDSDATGRAWNVNTVMRRRYNTTRERYARALARARTSSFLARRAIEFRLGVDMADMDAAMTLVDAPSTWINDACSMDGCDYDAIRTSGEVEDPEGDGHEHYANEFIGEYVNRLEDFVESYSIDYSFSDSTDTSVISLRELAASQDLACWGEGISRNLIYDSDNLTAFNYEGGDGDGYIEGEWLRTGCIEHPDSEAGARHYDGCLNVENNADWIGGHFCNDEYCFDAELIEDEIVSSETARPYGATNAGYVFQRIRNLNTGIYLLSYFVKDGDADSSVSYRVRVYSESAETPVIVHDELPTGDWRQIFLYFEVTPGQNDVRIEFHPSSDDSTVVLNTGERLCEEGETAPCYCDIDSSYCIEQNPSAQIGSILIGGVQVIETNEAGMPPRCTDALGFCEIAEAAHSDPASWTGCCYMPRNYYRTTHERGQWVACEDPTHFDFQSAFDRGCEDREGRSCDPRYDVDCWCYRQMTFPLLISQIESGDLFQTMPLAGHNYNYRQNRIALNVQGSNVMQCGPDAPSSCYSNGTLQYSLEHSGADMPIRNWSGDTVLFNMPTGRIQRGRALAAEVVVTNPLSSSQRNNFNDFWREELRGRPLQGLYTLRIWEDDALQWENVEDIQLILDYRYWTRFGD